MVRNGNGWMVDYLGFEMAGRVEVRNGGKIWGSKWLEFRQESANTHPNIVHIMSGDIFGTWLNWF